MRIILSFATEVAYLSKDHDHIKAMAELLTNEGLVGNFHLTGDYARALKRCCRLDVVEALKKHEIGFHCNHHGAAPFMGTYMEEKDWRGALSEWFTNELPGVGVVAELFERHPVYYTTEFAKAPQAIYGSRLAGLPITGYSPMPTRGHGAVWYCNSFVPNSENLCELEVPSEPDIDLEQLFQSQFHKFEGKMKRQETDLLRVIQHSYKVYAVRPFKRPHPNRYQDDSLYYEDFPAYMEIRPEAELRRDYATIERAIRYYADRAEFVSYSRYRSSFSGSEGHWLGLGELDALCAFLCRQLDAYVMDTLCVSPAEAFAMLVRVLRTHHEEGVLPQRVFMRNVIGPTSFMPEKLSGGTVRTSSLLNALKAVDRALDNEQALPCCVDIEGTTVGPGQMLRGLRDMYVALRAGQAPESVELSGSNFPAIADEEFFRQEMFTRPSYPEGFEGRNICKMCRLQSWSWKPCHGRGQT